MFSKQFGRLRDVCVSPSGDIYLATSNRDWNPAARFSIASDDRIISISRIGVIPKDERKKVENRNQLAESSASLYSNYCESCHKADGRGVPGSFPSLVGSVKLNAKKEELINKLLKGGQSATGEAMPSFSFLSDSQLSKLAAYLKKNFAPGLPVITSEDFKGFR
jgi:mono/diheme cytochrome c family protein